jgi:hypothetical protein
MSKESSLTIFRKKVSRSYENLCVAYHEAGHVICALLKYMRVEGATIYEDAKIKQMCGETLFYSYEDHAFNQQLLNYFSIGEICVNYAGLVTEKIFYKKISGSNKFPSFLKDGSSLDTQAAAKILKKSNIVPSGKQRYLYKQKITKQLLSLLENYWSDIELIAHILIQKKKINYKQIKYSLLRRSSNKILWKQRLKTIEFISSLESKGLDDQVLKLIINM